MPDISVGWLYSRAQNMLQVFFLFSAVCNIALKLDIKSFPFNYSLLPLHCTRHNFPCFLGTPTLVVLGLLRAEVSILHSDTANSVGILWTSDGHVSGSSTLQHTALTRDRHPCSGGIRTRNLNKRAAVDPRLRPRGYRGRPYITCNVKKRILFIQIKKQGQDAVV
jgi:hypothetical protein